ncbi:MAG: CapA family protein [Candidatus Hydrogenedentota bacterium]
MVRILIGGDTFPGGCNLPCFEQGDAHALLGGLLPEFEAADLRLVNLECPLIDAETPISKVGPNLGAPVACAHGLKAMGIDVACLANNHIMDHGAQGLRSSVAALEANGIAHVGAGENLAAARRLHVHAVGGVRVGILAMAEHEFSIAGAHTPGANPLDVIDFVRRMEADRAACDVLIVLCHAGALHHPYPSPALLKMARFFVEQGADAVLCQHSHCVGCIETYRGAPIVYGQGNFLFDHGPRPAAWYEGLLVTLTIAAGGAVEARCIPVRQCAEEPGVCRMPQAQEAAFADALDARSAALADETFVEQQWQAFCRERRRYYLNRIRGRRGLVRRVVSKFGMHGNRTAPAAVRQQLHLVRCESHREALTTVLTQEAGAVDSAPCGADAVPGSSEPAREER